MFGEMFTTRLMVGIVFILVAVLIIVLGENSKNGARKVPYISSILHQ